MSSCLHCQAPAATVRLLHAPDALCAPCWREEMLAVAEDTPLLDEAASRAARAYRATLSTVGPVHHDAKAALATVEQIIREAQAEGRL